MEDRFAMRTRIWCASVGDGLFVICQVAELERLPGFRNVLVHEYLDLDLARAVETRLEPVERFVRIVRDLEAGAG
jgi:uncharacterized protein YutE (UPF0331/DUF86 family)